MRIIKNLARVSNVVDIVRAFGIARTLDVFASARCMDAKEKSDFLVVLVVAMAVKHRNTFSGVLEAACKFEWESKGGLRGEPWFRWVARTALHLLGKKDVHRVIEEQYELAFERGD